MSSDKGQEVYVLLTRIRRNKQRNFKSVRSGLCGHFVSLPRPDGLGHITRGYGVPDPAGLPPKFALLGELPISPSRCGALKTQKIGIRKYKN